MTIVAFESLLSFRRDIPRIEYFIAAVGVAILPLALYRIFLQPVLGPMTESAVVLSTLCALLGSVVAGYLLSENESSGIVKLGATIGILSFITSFFFNLMETGDWPATLLGYLLGAYLGIYIKKTLR